MDLLISSILNNITILIITIVSQMLDPCNNLVLPIRLVFSAINRYIHLPTLNINELWTFIYLCTVLECPGKCCNLLVYGRRAAKSRNSPDRLVIYCFCSATTRAFIILCILLILVTAYSQIITPLKIQILDFQLSS